MGEILPDGSIQRGYMGVCQECKKTIKVNVQGNEIGHHDCIGLVPDEICNRNGCQGIIQEGEKVGDGCSCHINPPCSYCMEDTAYCPECDWEA